MTVDEPEPAAAFAQPLAPTAIPQIDPEWGRYPAEYGEQHPAARLVELLKAHRVIDASCDGEGADDVRLLLDNDQVIMIDSDLALDEDSRAAARTIGRPVPWSRLIVAIATRSEAWPPDQPR